VSTIAATTGESTSSLGADQKARTTEVRTGVKTVCLLLTKC